MQPELEQFLSQYILRSDKFFKDFLKEKRFQAKKINPSLLENLEAFYNYSQGGKKLRGALSLLGYSVAGGKNQSKILPIACGIECIHNYLLIDDDIVDNDLHRRGKPTIHTLYAKKHGRHYGISKAIEIADMGSKLGYESFLLSDFSKEKIVAGLKILNNHLLTTIYGELMDIDCDYKNDITFDDILKVRKYKTAYYTFIMPMLVGATFADPKNKLYLPIREFGEPLGIAFQLVDDILGIYGQSKNTGKSNNSDIKGGKKTLLYAKAFENADKIQQKFLKTNYGNKNITQRNIIKIKEIIKNTGSFDYSLTRAKNLGNKAKKTIPKITGDKKYQLLLKQIVDFVIERNR